VRIDLDLLERITPLSWALLALRHLENAVVAAQDFPDGARGARQAHVLVDEFGTTRQVVENG
jgi:hypothetical protein